MNDPITNRTCGTCCNYNLKKQKCDFYHKRLPNTAYCVIEEDTAFFIT
ncbi:MAG: hypothetical protein GF317_18370 [Candidatus Lokiarchaeota archaeon]|nr:hypothetical protein [Candidatus Lokiarchaeota archaeon]MBD3201482.1 hypothetical protein [Candidatus Lokiarchaeota archaeon]